MGEVYTYVNFQPEIPNCELARQGSELSPTSFQFSPNIDKFSSPIEKFSDNIEKFSDTDRHLSDQAGSRPSSRLHETHFGSSVNSIPCTVVHSPIEVSSLSPEQLRLTPISTIDRGVRHIQLATTRLFPLGPAAPIDRMPHVQFRPNGTIFDCELGCFIPLAEYQKRRSKE